MEVDKTMAFEVVVGDASWNEKAAKKFRHRSTFDFIIAAQRFSTRFLVDSLRDVLGFFPNVCSANLYPTLRKIIPDPVFSSCFWIYFSPVPYFDGDGVENLKCPVEKEEEISLEEGFYFGFVQLVTERESMITSEAILSTSGKRVLNLSDLGSVLCDVVQTNEHSDVKEIRIFFRAQRCFFVSGLYPYEQMASLGNVVTIPEACGAYAEVKKGTRKELAKYASLAGDRENQGSSLFTELTMTVTSSARKEKNLMKQT